MTEPVPATPNADVDTILEIPETVKLESGTVVLLNRLKTRELLKLLRVITRGAGPQLMDMRLDPNDPAFPIKLMGMVVFAIPEAEQETIEFIFACAKPDGLIDRPKLSSQDRERNLELWTNLANELENPELDDLITIIEAVIAREAPDLMRLGKRLQKMWEMAKVAGKGRIANPPDPTSLTSLVTSTSDRSFSSATSSSPSTPEPTEGTKTSSPGTTSVNFAKSPEQLFGDAT